ncbi:MAG: flavin reductase family protein [Bacteroidota bacterium]|jgi:flavin reductase (DIM6/NTAB) family NADH-FMN oxidoreductase RutF
MKRPWNRTDLPVYSIGTKFKESYNLNICTYVSGASMDPKRMSVAIYKGTKTLELAEKEKMIVLQMLSKDQINLVKHLGFKSGKHFEKISYLEKKGLITEWKDFKVLRNSLAYILLKQYDSIDAGDHILFVYDVVGFINNRDAEGLTLNELRRKKIIRG